MYPVCGGPTGSLSNQTMFAPAPTVTLTTPLTELVIVAFELEEVEATFSLAGTASVIFSFAPGWVVTVVEQPAVALLTPAVAVTVGGADRERELRALHRRAGAVLADLDRRGGLRVGDRHLRLLAGHDQHLGLADLVVLRQAARKQAAPRRRPGSRCRSRCPRGSPSSPPPR